MAEIRFVIAREFSKYPGGRYRSHGSKSGEEFREDHLLPLLYNEQQIVIDLSGTAGYGASFLDESFGEAGKVFGVDELRERLTLQSEDDPLLVNLIWNIIEDGAAEKNDL